MKLCPLEGSQILPFLKIFKTDFSEPLKACINMDNDWMYRVYRGKGSITHGVMSFGSFSFPNFTILEIFKPQHFSAHVFLL